MTPVSHGKPCAGNPHARFEEGASAPESPRRNALLHKDEAEKSTETREGTPVRVPYIGKPEKKRKCWRPPRIEKDKK